jgi:hypothetical protein
MSGNNTQKATSPDKHQIELVASFLETGTLQ